MISGNIKFLEPSEVTPGLQRDCFTFFYLLRLGYMKRMPKIKFIFSYLSNVWIMVCRIFFNMYVECFWIHSDPKVAFVLENWCFFCHGAITYSGPGLSYCRGFMITVGRTALGEWSARSRDICLTIHSTHNRQIRDSKPQSRQASGSRPTP